MYFLHHHQDNKVTVVKSYFTGIREQSRHATETGCRATEQRRNNSQDADSDERIDKKHKTEVITTVNF